MCIQKKHTLGQKCEADDKWVSLKSGPIHSGLKDKAEPTSK